MGILPWKAEGGGAADRQKQSRTASFAKQYTWKRKNASSRQASLAVLKELQGKGIEPDAYQFNASIRVCVRARQWRKALELLQELDKCGATPIFFCCNAAISACGWQMEESTGAASRDGKA
jgi:pentatricopeptide repeat protein